MSTSRATLQQAADPWHEFIATDGHVSARESEHLPVLQMLYTNKQSAVPESRQPAAPAAVFPSTARARLTLCTQRQRAVLLLRAQEVAGGHLEVSESMNGAAGTAGTAAHDKRTGGMYSAYAGPNRI